MTGMNTDQWTREQTDKARTRHQQYRTIAEAERRARRQSMTLEQRWAHLKCGVLLQAGARAAVVGRNPRSADGGGLPIRKYAGFEIGAMDGREAQALVRIIEEAIVAMRDPDLIDDVPRLERRAFWAVAKLEAALDGHRTDGGVLLSFEKDDLIRSYAEDGLSPAEIHERQPELGSIKVIERVLQGLPV